jgi:hypothetical protein
MHDDDRIALALVEYHLDDLPEKTAGTYLVVDLDVAIAARGRADLLVPHLEVHDTAGDVIGHRRLASPS